MNQENRTKLTKLMAKKNDITHDEFTTIKTILTEYGEVSDNNSHNLIDILQDTRFLKITTQIINNQTWCEGLNVDEIRILTSYHKQCQIMVANNTIQVSEPSQINTSSLSNNSIKKTVNQYMTMDETRPKTWFKIDPVITCFTVIIKIRGLKNKGNLTVAAQIQSEIESLLMQHDKPSIKVRKIVPSFECCKVQCETSQLRKNLMELIKTEKPEWYCETMMIRPPQIKLISVRHYDPTKDTDNKFIRFLEKKNQWPVDKEDNKVIAYSQTICGHDLIVQISSAIREKIEQNNGWVNLGYSDIRAIDYFNIKLCRKCAGFGHTIKDCKHMTRCGYCTKRHSGTCQFQSNQNDWTCPNCRKKGHNAFQIICPVFTQRLRMEIERVNFPYEQIMY